MIDFDRRSLNTTIPKEYRREFIRLYHRILPEKGNFLV